MEQKLASDDVDVMMIVVVWHYSVNFLSMKIFRPKPFAKVFSHPKELNTFKVVDFSSPFVGTVADIKSEKEHKTIAIQNYESSSSLTRESDPVFGLGRPEAPDSALLGITVRVSKMAGR